MGYFSNGTEGMLYEEKYCEKCAHYDVWGGCPVLTAHIAYNGERPHSEVLDMLIPRSENRLYNEKCLMFMEAKP